MTCRHVDHLRDAYLDGELSANLAAEVHAHLLQCRSCQQDFDMQRIAGEVIAQDAAEPRLGAGFASSVVAAMARANVVTPSGHAIARPDRRARILRIFATASVPAMAASLFLAVLIWPTEKPAMRHGEVAGVQVKVEPTDLVKEAAAETMNALAETRRATRSIGAVGQLLVDEARAGVAPDSEVSLLDVFLEPFNEVLVPAAETARQPDEPGVVRF